MNHEVNTGTPRHAPRRGQRGLLRAVVRQRAAPLRHRPAAANTIPDHMHGASSCHWKSSGSGSSSTTRGTIGCPFGSGRARRSPSEGARRTGRRDSVRLAARPRSAHARTEYNVGLRSEFVILHVSDASFDLFSRGESICLDDPATTMSTREARRESLDPWTAARSERRMPAPARRSPRLPSRTPRTLSK